MRRRAVVAGLAGAVLAATHASGQARARVGWLTVAPHPGINGFLEGMRELGWVEGDTLAIEYAYAEGRPERLPELAAALARGPVQLVVASGSDAVVAARAHITAKPVVAVSTGAAVGVGENLARPSGNLTGISLMTDETAAKWVEVLAEVLPSSTRFGVVHDASLTNREQFENARRAAATLRREAISLEIESLDGLDAAIALARREAVAGLIFVSSPVFTANAARIVEAVRASGLPAVYESRWLVEKGGLMAYGPDFNAVFRRAASLADRLLKGARPADLPIEQPTRFHFSLNRATARALGVEIPTSLLVRADEVFE
ncbi:MAG: ABC transporter substrate-binding protein [Microvirga sp.]|jgi:putative ABC transport system substrate-binding protein